MTEETVTPQEEIVQDMVQTAEAVQEPVETQAETVPEMREEHVPLSALKKERKRRQELEQQLEWERQQRPAQQAPEEDLSKYESATREDLSRVQEEAMRGFEERLWIKQNPEKYEKVNENLQTFLKQRPNLASAIANAGNRWDEAYTLMEALTPKQKQQLKVASVPKKEAPQSPSGVPKAAAMNEAIDVMNMSDSEFSSWRQSQKKRR